MKELNELCDMMDNLYPVIKNEIKEHIFPTYATKVIETLDSIDHKKYEPNDNNEPVTCTICQDDINPGMIVPIIKCNHVFHYHCLIKYYFSGCATCPTCRCTLYEVPDFNISDIHNIDLVRDRVKRILGIHDHRTYPRGELIRINTLYKRGAHYDPMIWG